ncbi:MAG: hypothetical protein HZB25_02525 [Candidatus Eisenbacteria bacterium]|nr:hypothetical protein [Candidatus Eisenbacteria bacterium]
MPVPDRRAFKTSIGAIGALALILAAAAAHAAGTTTGAFSGGVQQHPVNGPIISMPPLIHPTSGNKWWVLCFTMCPEYICSSGAGGAGFRTIPRTLAGPMAPDNGVVVALTLPENTHLRGLTLLPHGSVVNPMDDPAPWTAAYPPSTGMSPFVPAPGTEYVETYADLGSNSQVFESAGPAVISDSFFDIFCLVETSDSLQRASFEVPGLLGLYAVDYAFQALAQIHLSSNPADPCTGGAPQLLAYQLQVCGATPVQPTTWGSLKRAYGPGRAATKPPPGRPARR